jgi:hypothetical protein
LSEVFSIKAFITRSMIAFMPPMLAAGAALIFLLLASPNPFAAEPGQHEEPSVDLLDRWRP